MMVILWLAAMSLCFLAGLSVEAQAIRFQFPQVRVTVPVGSSNSTLVAGFPTTNNTVLLLNGASNAFFNVSGLPSGATAVLTDTNGNVLSSISNSTAVWLTLNTTNVPEGVYNFTLNAGGFDTNNLPITNSMPFVLQSAYVWYGNGLGALSFGVSNNWANASSWVGGAVPAATDDVVISDSGAQTNVSAFNAATFNNIGVQANATVASIRFSQNTFYTLVTTSNIVYVTNTDHLTFTNIIPTATNVYIPTTNSLYHQIKINPGVILSVTGTNGFGVLRDYVTDGNFGPSPENPMGVSIIGTNATLVVSNASANFAVLDGNGLQPTLSFTNLGTFIGYVSRMGVADYQLYPNYRAINNAYNGGRDTNSYAGLPRKFYANFYLARSNYITATYADSNNYTNEFTRSYAICLQNNEQSGNGSSVNTFFLMGITNVFHADSVCFMGSSSATGNGGGDRFNVFERQGTNTSAVFRSTNGTGRMSMFCVSDDGGTNEASSNIKAIIDFSGSSGGNSPGNGYIDLLVDRLYVARDRTMIASNQTPNVQGTLIFGNGNADINKAYLGCQEHSNKVDWTTLFGAQPYLNYCQGSLVVTNGGYIPSTVHINGALTLGYTADNNPVGSAQQYNTYGQLTIYSNCTVMVSNIICDGGLNYYDSHGRQNNITINRGGNLVITNTIGYPNPGANNFTAADPRGMYLDSLSITGGKLTLYADPTQIKVFVRNLTTPGIVPSVIKVLALNNVSSFPVQIPVISYQGSASPFINADVSSLGTNYFGYVLNNIPNNSVDVYITTNSPNNLIWTGSVNNNWDASTANFVLAGTSTPTNFNLGDVVTFNDSSTVTNVNIVNSVVPSQTGVGMTISNSADQYSFSSGTVAGTALVAKLGTNLVTFNATEQGPINITAGTFTGSGQIGTAVVYSNVVLNYSGNINGGLTSTGTVLFTAGTLNGPVVLGGGYMVNSGTINTLGNNVITMVPGTAITNISGANINVGSGPANQATYAWDVPTGCTLANFGTITLYTPKLTVEGLLFGTGTIQNPGGGFDSIANTADPRLVIGPLGVLSPGLTPINSIVNPSSGMDLYCRLDFNNDPSAGQGIAGVGTVRIEVDFSNPYVNDTINCDRWNNDTGFLLMTNINPGAGSFTGGQTFQIFANSSGASYNYQDTLGFCPTIIPYTPGHGLVWGVSNFNYYGSVSVTNCPMVWDGASSSNWSTNTTDTSWKTGQFFSDNQGAVFDDSASGTTTVNLTGSVAPESYPSTTITNIVPNVSTNIVIITNQPAIYPGIVVSNALLNYVITGSGHIRGMTGLYKTGPGTLTLMTSNDWVGNVIVDNGTLAITNAGGNPNIVSLGIQGSGQNENDVILDGGTLNYVGTTNVNLSNGKNSYTVFNPNGGTIGVASSSNILTLNHSSTGLGSLTKTGPGALSMSQTINNYYGGTIVNAGTLQLTAAAVGYGGVTLNNIAALQFTNNFTLTNTMNVSGPATSIQILGTSTNILSGSWFGSGSVTFSNVNNLFMFNGDLSGFSGTLSLGTSSGQFQFNVATNKNPCTGSAAASFNLGTGSATLDNFNGSNLVYNLGALSGGPNTVLTGRSTNSASPPGTTYSIGANGSSTTFSGTITNGLDTVSIVKVGGGGLLLNGISTYTGSTTVSNGVLGGTGSIASPLTVTSGGTLSPGLPLGTFTVSNSVALGGTTFMELNQSSPATNSELAVTGTLAGGGALIVTNVGPTLINGSTFQLFSKLVPVASFSSITLPTGGGSYQWTTNLGVNGSITLVSGGANGVNTNSTNIVYGVTNNTLTLSWPADHTGWRLQVQTNSLSVGISTNWATVPGSTTTNSVPVPIVTTNGSVFYRLIYP